MYRSNMKGKLFFFIYNEESKKLFKHKYFDSFVNTSLNLDNEFKGNKRIRKSELRIFDENKFDASFEIILKFMKNYRVQYSSKKRVSQISKSFMVNKGIIKKSITQKIILSEEYQKKNGVVGRILI